MPTPAQPSVPGVRLRPFRAVRYNPATAGDLAHVLCPPHDDVGPSRARAPRHRRHHLARLVYSPDPGTAARQRLERWMHRGILVRDQRPAFYVYQQHLGAKILFRGVIGELDLPTATPAAVLPHEDVQAHVVGQRAAHMQGLRAQLEPLLLTYRAPGSPAPAAMDDITRRPPLATARIGLITHTVWACTDPREQAAVGRHLGGAGALIADGHHRYAACLRLNDQHPGGPWARSLALLVDQTAHPLQLKAIHRVVPGLEPDKAVAAAAEAMRVRPLPEGVRRPMPGELLITAEGKAWSLTAPDPRSLDEALEGRPAEWRDVPTAVSDHLLMDLTWSVLDLPGGVHHVHDTRQAVASTATPGSGIAVLLPAVREETVRTLAAAGVLLPHKTTSFGPKPTTGLALRVLDAP
ncbi:DUF1015 domain-containing protein [Streptomyces sp. HNM0645]|uniref:DUF1015 domain-containing protein n=1 Tax=Streptomyces sp. HNM0645 TaxID=2782343 RepID=UPI0024B718AD|nr:DUF1015 domain-containing protein [Streptomyces sp. HNM0645]MDI9883706.1 DUF1015 domain-containing protein [Streptomyces sp. HNM0645]